MIPTPNPQLGPLTALTQLVQEFPHLPGVLWRLAPDGFLMGDLSVTTDARAVMDLFVSVFGGEPVETRYSHGTEARFSSWLSVSWRDVRLSVTVMCPVEALAPVALPSEWSAKQVAA